MNDKKKFRYLSEYDINGINMIKIINETINEYYSMNEISVIISTTISITSEDNENRTLNIEVLLFIESKYNEIASKLEENINNKKDYTFYNLISKKSNNLYSYCLITDIPTTSTTTETTSPTIPIVIECIYPSKSVFIYKTGLKIISNSNSLTNSDGNNVVVKYKSSSNSDCFIDKNSGNITINTNNRITDGFIKCIITCSYENIKDEISIIQYKITTYSPKVDTLLSLFPYNIYQNEEFDVKLTLVYPFITDLVIDGENEEDLLRPNMNISLNINSENNKYILQDSPIYKTSKTVYEYNNLIVTNATERILEERDNDDDDDDDDDKITFKFMNESTNIFTSEKITVIGIKSLNNCKKEERDKMGLCCVDVSIKECINGIICKNLTFIIPFLNDIDSELYNTYYQVFDEIIFNNTNYLWFSFIEELNKKLLVVKINILNNTINDNNRLLLEEKKEKEIEIKEDKFIFEDYGYIKSVLSILECTNEVEIEERISVLPSDIKEILIKSKLDSKMKESIKEINEVSEKTGNRIDYDIGITSQFNYKSDNNNDHNDDDDDNDDENKKKKWYEEIYVLVVIGIVVLLVVIIIVSYCLAYIGQKIEEKKMRKNEVVMQQNVVPIEKIRENYNNSNDLIYRPNNQKIIKEGYLMKENHDRIYDKYQRRYCVLYSNPIVLRIYGSMTPSYYGKVYLDEKQSIPLECYNGIEYEEGSNEFTLKLKIRESYLMTYEPGDKEIKISFKVDEEIENCGLMAKEWVENIMNYKNLKPVVSEAWTKSSTAANKEDENNSQSLRSTTEYYKPKMMEKAKNRKQGVGGAMSVGNKRTVTVKSN